MIPSSPRLPDAGLDLAEAPGLCLADLPAGSPVWRELVRAYLANPASPGRPVQVGRLAAEALLVQPLPPTQE